MGLFLYKPFFLCGFDCSRRGSGVLGFLFDYCGIWLRYWWICCNKQVLFSLVWDNGLFADLFLYKSFFLALLRFIGAYQGNKNMLVSSIRVTDGFSICYIYEIVKWKIATRYAMKYKRAKMGIPCTRWNNIDKNERICSYEQVLFLAFLRLFGELQRNMLKNIIGLRIPGFPYIEKAEK